MAWHVDLGEEEYVMCNFEVVATSIYGREDIILADGGQNSWFICYFVKKQN